MSKAISITAPGATLEAVFTEGDKTRGGVVAHPHPLYGGSMHNNVVAAAAKALSQIGWSSLCFNFRGVGRSTGNHGQGVGERDDLTAATEFLSGQGIVQPVVIGYSFGAWTAAFAWARLKELGARPLILIAPPAAVMDFEGLSPETEIGLIISGECDEFCPLSLAEELGRSLAAPVSPVVFRGADHFFGGFENKLTATLAGYLTGAGALTDHPAQAL
ncbi:MAG: alpha/beta fold hydrolase [Pseudomonadota bacterium]